MKTYRLDNINFTGTAKDLVKKLHKASRAQSPTDDQWMKEVADRFHLANGATIRTSSFEKFVDDLIAKDLIDALVQQ